MAAGMRGATVFSDDINSQTGRLATNTEKAFQDIEFAEPPLRCRRIAIVGYAETCWPPEHVWADQTIERWTLNHGHNIDPRWDRLFEFHDRAVIEAESAAHFRGVDQWRALQEIADRPVYMKATEPGVPCSVAFPVQQFVEFFGAGCDKLARRPYAEMAAAYMLGYAIMLLCRGARTNGPEFGSEILVYGFELFDGEEYDHQRACFEMYAGWAMGAGIRVTVPDTSAIFSTRGLYEYQTGETSRLLNQADQYLKERFDEVTRTFQTAKARNDQAVAEMQTISGGMQEVEQQRKFVRHLLKGGNYR